jgi:hypothetical protein
VDGIEEELEAAQRQLAATSAVLAEALSLSQLEAPRTPQRADERARAATASATASATLPSPKQPQQPLSPRGAEARPEQARSEPARAAAAAAASSSSSASAAAGPAAAASSPRRAPTPWELHLRLHEESVRSGQLSRRLRNASAHVSELESLTFEQHVALVEERDSLRGELETQKFELERARAEAGVLARQLEEADARKNQLERAQLELRALVSNLLSEKKGGQLAAQRSQAIADELAGDAALLLKSEPPAGFPVPQAQRATALELERTRAQLGAALRDNAELKRQLDAASDALTKARASRAARETELETQLRKQHTHLVGAVRRIKWLLFEREREAKARAGAEAYTHQLEAKVLEQSDQLRRLGAARRAPVAQQRRRPPAAGEPRAAEGAASAVRGRPELGEQVRSILAQQFGDVV